MEQPEANNTQDKIPYKLSLILYFFSIKYKRQPPASNYAWAKDK